MGKVGTQSRLWVITLYLFNRYSNFFEEMSKRPSTDMILENKFLIPLDFDKKCVMLMAIIIALLSWKEVRIMLLSG